MREIFGSYYPEDPERGGMNAVAQRIDFKLAEVDRGWGESKLFYTGGTREIEGPMAEEIRGRLWEVFRGCDDSSSKSRVVVRDIVDNEY